MPKVIHEADVFAAACKTFTRWGYQNATTRMLAEAAGVHEATLFRKYQSKEKLYIKAMEHEFSRVPLARVGYTGDLHADLSGIVNAYVETLQSHGDIVTLLFIEVQRHPELHEASVVPMRNIRAIQSVVERYQARGCLIREDAMQTVAALIGPLMVRDIHRRVGPPALRSDVDVQNHLDRFLLGRRPGGSLPEC